MTAASERSMTMRRLISWLRVPDLGTDPRVLFEVRRLGVVPEWLQVAAVVGLFLATVFLTHAEYRSKGTVFGYAGPGFNALVCPIYEELIFRGWILGRVTRWKSPLAGVVVSSLLFGLLHLRNVYWLEPLPLLRLVVVTCAILGPLLGYVALRCRSDWPAVILHYLNNLLYFLRH